MEQEFISHYRQIELEKMFKESSTQSDLKKAINHMNLLNFAAASSGTKDNRLSTLQSMNPHLTMYRNSMNKSVDVFTPIQVDTEVFYSDEMFYYMADMLLLRGQFYLKSFNNYDKAVVFFLKAESLALKLYESMNPAHIRLLVKIRLMISRLY